MWVWVGGCGGGHQWGQSWRDRPPARRRRRRPHSSVWLPHRDTVWLPDKDTVWLPDKDTVLLPDKDTVWLPDKDTFVSVEHKNSMFLGRK